MPRKIHRILLGLAVAGTAILATPPKAGYDVSIAMESCRTLPGDSSWPKSHYWNGLNSTVHGRLIATVPIASVCHDAPFHHFNAAQCATLQNEWNKTTLSHLEQPSEFLSMYFQNYTCDAFTPISVPCELGNSVSYVINVTDVSDIIAGIKFARKHNVRLVIKNTGHDYLGKSTGKGGLSLWRYNLKSTQYIPDYQAAYYAGPAMKIGAGVGGYQAYAAADAAGHRVVGGSCPTVGIAGGYSQGGGHSMLSSLYGLAADNVLEWEVVTMDGHHLVASPTQNQDLYWAMSGGGGGNYAVAISMTVRLHQDGQFGGAALSFNDSSVGNKAFWDAVGAYHVLLGPFVDSGNSATYTMTNKTFLSWGIAMPGADLVKIQSLMQPFLDDLTRRGIRYQYTPHVSHSFYEHYSHYFGPLPQGFADYAPFTGSRILPRAMFEDPAKNPIVTEALRKASLAEGWAPITCQALNVSHQAHSGNAVLPAWRDSIAICLTPGDWDPKATRAEMAARQDYAVNVLQPMLDKATPGGGVYMNEANYQQKNWQNEFYGSNYARLLEIKKKYDPEGLMYSHLAVGSDAWYEDGENRLCRA